MTFEIVIKSAGLGIPSNAISVTKSGFSFGLDVINKFGKESFVEIYLDRDKNRVGFKSTKSNITGFKFHRGKSTGSLGTLKTSSMIPKGLYESKIEGDFVVIEVPEILRESQAVKDGEER